MSLPVVSGRGFLLTDGVELKFAKSGNAYARMPLAFKNNRKDAATGEWKHDKEIIVEATVFGALAEGLAQLVTSRQEIALTAELYVEEYEGKKYVRANVLSAWPVKENPSNSFKGGGSAPTENIPF